MDVLIVVDMQNDFIDGALGTPEAVKILPRVLEKIEEYEKNGDLIIYTKDTHCPNYLDTAEGKKLPVEHCIKGTHGHEIRKELLRDGGIIIEKPTFGSFELVEYLKSISFDTVELIGVCTDICVISNALLIKAAFYEKEVRVDSTACAGVSPESSAKALDTMKMCQIEVI